jgi:hypothetical protein
MIEVIRYLFRVSALLFFRGWMYAIIESHFVPLEGKFLLIALVIVRITLNVIVRQMPLNIRYTKVCPSFKNLLSNSQTLRLIDWLINWVLTPLSAVFQLYRDDQFLVVEEVGVPRENHRPWAGNWSTLSLAAASWVHPFLWFTELCANSRRIGDRLVWAVRSNDLTYWATRAPSNTLTTFSQHVEITLLKCLRV